MNKEAEMHLSELPRLNKPRSTFPYSQSIWGSMSVGKLYPLEWIECNPGDTLTLDFAHITRAMTQIVPVMDQSFLDVQAFAVPERLVWKNWECFWGENKTGHWAQTTPYEVPQIKFPSGGWASGSLADVLGLPVYRGGTSDTTSHLPIRAYCKIWNDWYRYEAVQDPCYFHDDETTINGANYASGWDYVTDTEKGGALLPVCRFHDYFSSCTPDLQCGPSVEIPLGATAPIIGTDNVYDSTTLQSSLVGKELDARGTLISSGGSSYTINRLFDNESAGDSLDYSKSIGLAADLSSAIGATITQLRQSIAVQHFYEQLANGNRYIEYLSSIWGTEARDDTLQRSTYLGGRRFPININQVLQTSSSDAVSPQGNTGAFSCTVDEDDLFTVSTTEHCLVFIMGCIRTNHSYSQGIPRKFSRKKWTDYYIPTFDGLSNMAVLNKEIYFTGAGVGSKDEEVFGYQESFADYRIQTDRVFGQLRVDSKDSQGNANSLAVWTYQDDYNSLPMLNDEWIQEDGSNFERTISLQNTDSDQFQVQIYLKGKFSRVMPTYGIPGIKYI